MAYRLSKSRFQTGLQCEKALWLTVRAPELADPVPETRQHVFDTGTTVGERARERFPEGVLVSEDHTQSAAALETTRALLKQPPRAIFEAAFEFGGVFVRPDILVEAGGGLWDLYEVKSSTSVKSEHITDVAVQAWVVENAGLPLRRIHLMHLAKDYVFEGGDSYDLERLFTAEEVTAPARASIAEIPDLVSRMLAILKGERPDVRIGAHCDRPYTCAFYGHCHAHLPPRPVTTLPRIRPDVLDALIADGILAIEDVPPDYPGLTAAQREVCELVRSGVARIESGAAATLAGLERPLHFLDFETFASALPLFAGTRPWQQVPFQWSDHILHENGSLEHRDFLHEERSDPREAFIGTLLETLGERGAIVVYSSFEDVRLRELAEAFPQHARNIETVRARLFDLMRVVREHVRHPDCVGSASIKTVLPALVDDLDYDGLAITEGSTASLRYLRALRGEVPDAELGELFSDLRAYCGTDTLAMVKLHEVLVRSGEVEA